jgi:hypothetical protein
MTRTVRSFLPVVGDPEPLVAAFVGDPQRWLPSSRRDGPDRFVFNATARALARPVRAKIGAPWQHGSTHWRSISWDPVDAEGSPSPVDRLLPSLDGELGLHLGDRGGATLLLDARYRPPGGAVGLAADTIAMCRVARLTIEHIVGEIAARLGAEALLQPSEPFTPASMAPPPTPVSASG